MSHDCKGKVNWPIGLWVYITVYDLHVIDKIVFEVFIFEAISKEVIDIFSAFLIFEEIEPHGN